MRSDSHNTLDRIWVATRPVEPSAEAFDALWSDVTACAPEPEILPISHFAGWRKWHLHAAMFAQAAALLIGAFVALAPVKLGKSVVSNSEVVTANPEFRGEAGYTTYVSLGLDGLIRGIEVRPQAVDSETDVVTAEADILGFMEACESASAPPAVLDFTESY